MKVGSLRARTLILGIALVASQLAALSPADAGERSLAPVSTQFAQDVAALGGAARYAAFVHMTPSGYANRAQLLDRFGLTSSTTFPSVDVVYAVGTVDAFNAIRGAGDVTYLEANRRLQYTGDTSVWATRARVAQTAVAGGPYRDAAGNVLDGRGVGVAIVDSGIDGTHPDLMNRIGKNYKVVCTTPFLVNTQTEQCFGPVVAQELPMTDNTGGHGTHVAGIVAGDGTASSGTYKGVAPGATLYGYGAGEAIAVLTAAEAFQHILTHYNSFSPRIRVVSNSWGDPGGTAYDPNSVLSKLTKDLVAKGVTVTYAAGNDGGNGNADATSSTAKDPTPGVITVANYDDANTGTRSGQLASTSSRGRNGSPETYPDISAPGSLITSTCNAALPVCATGPTIPWAPFYSTISGTSMATPHISGVAALMYQANPNLTPAQVEDVIQDTALKFSFGAAYTSDPQNSGGTTSYDKGAGLVDVPAALNAIGAAHGTAPTGVQVIASGDGGDYPAQGAADITSLSVRGEAAGLRYTLGVRDVDDVGPTTVSLRVTQNVNGSPFLTSLTLSSTGVTIPAASTSNTALATEATRDTVANTVTFLVPFSNLGNPPVGSIGHNVFASSFVGLIVDAAPGLTPADPIARPQFGAPYTVQTS